MRRNSSESRKTEGSVKHELRGPNTKNSNYLKGTVPVTLPPSSWGPLPHLQSQGPQAPGFPEGTHKHVPSSTALLGLTLCSQRGSINIL